MTTFNSKSMKHIEYNFLPFCDFSNNTKDIFCTLHLPAALISKTYDTEEHSYFTNNLFVKLYFMQSHKQALSSFAVMQPWITQSSAHFHGLYMWVTQCGVEMGSFQDTWTAYILGALRALEF